MEHLSNDILSEIINFCDCQLQTSIWVANKKLKELFFKYNSCNKIIIFFTTLNLHNMDFLINALENYDSEDDYSIKFLNN